MSEEVRGEVCKGTCMAVSHLGFVFRILLNDAVGNER